MKPYVLAAYNWLRFRWIKLRSCKNLCAGSVELLGWNSRFSFHPQSSVTLGERVVSDGRTVIITGSQATLKIGSSVYFNENAMISCKNSVSIGDGCRFGPNISIWDNDHKYSAQEGVSAEHVTSPVVIGKNCWIGTNVVILRGSSIGDNCVIGAGCVIKGNIPAGTLVTASRELNFRSI